jgi:hypothetical protein
LCAIAGFDLSWKKIDAWSRFEPVWLLMRGASGRYEASLLRAAEPGGTADAKGSQWARLLAVATLCDRESDEATELWKRYRTTAGVEL